MRGSRAPSILERIVERKRVRVRQLKAARGAPQGDPGPARGFGEALHRSRGVRLVAEFKRASPSAGAINTEADPVTVARGYEDGGAAAISVLTEEDFFRGSFSDLEAARRGCSIPVLAKDFVVDRWQIGEARRWGADAVLLIVRVLDPSELREFIGEAAEAGLAALVEAYSAQEVETALDAGARIVGINNRDLDTMQVDVCRTQVLCRGIPEGIITVAESGIRSREDMEFVSRCGVDAVLVGEALMRGADPSERVRELLG